MGESETTSGNALAPFTVFSDKANKKIHQEFVSQQEQAHKYIAELEKLLNEKGIEIPDFVHEYKKQVQSNDSAGRTRRVSGLMEDGSLEALTKSIEKHEDHVHRYEIQVQYRNLTFWNMVAKKTISTVGSSIIGMVVGGKKSRVNIINNLTGRILPKRMTLVMGPPGCGEYLHGFA
jgi:hypothetical protein